MAFRANKLIYTKKNEKRDVRIQWVSKNVFIQ